jgi:UDP-3-O-[3-hydroxymyristoyl] N-acetylglucosamine deacetylase
LAKQRTIAEKVTCTGIGLHSGAPVGLTLRPAAVDTGVVFVCRGASDVVEIPALAEFVSSTANATSLSRHGARVATVEHLLATLRCLGIDNVRVEVDGPEIPVMDGSAASFVYWVQTAGATVQAAPRRVVVVKAPVSYTDGKRSIRIEPSRVLRVSYAIDFEHPAIGRQQIELRDVTAKVFEKEISRARTFGFEKDYEALKRAGLAGGASLDNTVVIDDDGVMNPAGLRAPDEFVRHKVLDLLGDLALMGHPIRGHVRVERGGHSLHQALIEQLRAKPKAWKLVADDVPKSPGGVPAEFVSPI